MNAHDAASIANVDVLAQSAPLAVRVPEACRLTGIGRSKLYELIKSGDVEVIKIGTITLIPVRSLEALLGLPAPSPPDLTQQL